ncbi:hypothetical protein Tco_0012444 [Tanacetum coccineum]
MWAVGACELTYSVVLLSLILDCFTNFIVAVSSTHTSSQSTRTNVTVCWSPRSVRESVTLLTGMPTHECLDEMISTQNVRSLSEYAESSRCLLGHAAAAELVLTVQLSRAMRLPHVVLAVVLALLVTIWPPARSCAVRVASLLGCMSERTCAPLPLLLLVYGCCVCDACFLRELLCLSSLVSVAVLSPRTRVSECSLR